MCFVFISEQTATCAAYSINWLVFITEMKSVYCAVRTGSLNKAVCASVFKGIITWAANIPVCTSEYTIPPALKGNLHESKCPVPFWLLHTKVLLHKLYPVSFKKDCITIFWYTAWCNWADTYRSSMLYPENGGSRVVRNVETHTPNYMRLQSVRPWSSYGLSLLSRPRSRQVFVARKAWIRRDIHVTAVVLRDTIKDTA